MPHAPARVLQLDLFLGDARAYRDALARYETIRLMLSRSGRSPSTAGSRG